MARLPLTRTRSQFASLARRVDRVAAHSSAYSAASDTFNQGFMVHLARRVSASSQLLPNVHVSGALWRAGLWPARREQWREMRADVAGIEDRDAERRGRRTTRGHACPKQVGHTGRAVLSNGQAIQPRLGGAPQPHALRAMRYAVASL